MSKSKLPSHKTPDLERHQTQQHLVQLSGAALLKRTFKIDVLTCSRCGGPMTLVHAALTPVEIETTLVALGLSPGAPPIAPARQIGVFGSFDDSPPEPWPSE